MGTRMRVRLQGEEIRSLYATGVSSRFPSDVIEAFFGALEAVEAAPKADDLHALASLRFRNEPTDHIEFGLRSGWSLVGRREFEAGIPILIMEDIRGEGEGGPGD
jgi:plasmid maintenance system killer protein